MSQWNERNSSDWMKPNQRDHFSEGVRFSRWIEDVKSEEIYREQQERKDNEKLCVPSGSNGGLRDGTYDWVEELRSEDAREYGYHGA